MLILAIFEVALSRNQMSGRFEGWTGEMGLKVRKDRSLVSSNGTTRKKALWPEWVGKPAPRAIAVRGVRCPAHSPRYKARPYRRDLTLFGH